MNGSQRTTLLVLLMLCVLPTAWAVPPSGRVLDFQCAILMNPDSSLNVTETIKYLHAPQDTANGLYRFFPTQYAEAYGLHRQLRYTIQQVETDGGLRLPTRTIQKARGIVLEIGNAASLMPTGPHTFTISYRVENALDFLPTGPELLWHVTGRNWEVPIASIHVSVTPPRDTPPLSVYADAFYSAAGHQENISRVMVDGNGCAFAESPHPPAMHEGFDILVRLPPGSIPVPAQAHQLLQTFLDNTTLGIGMFALLIVLLYYLLMWWLHGRDPEAGVIQPKLTPPEGLSPAMLRFIRQERYDPKTLAVTLVSLAVQGKWTIEELEDRYILHRVGEAEGEQPRDLITTPRDKTVSLEEDTTLRILLGAHEQQQEFTFSYDHASTIAQAAKTLHKLLFDRCEDFYFALNHHYLNIGITLGILALLIISCFEVPTAYFNEQLRLMLGVLVIGIGAPLLPTYLLFMWRDIFSHHVGRIGNAGLMFRYLLYLLLYVGFGVYLLWEASSELWLVLALLTAMHVLFAHLLKAPTLRGRHLLDEIEGFRMYLAGEQPHLLATLTPPQPTPELFAKYLPYALALDVEREWASHFQHVFTPSQPAPAMDWYTGPAWEKHHPQQLAISLDEEMAPSMTPITVPVDGTYDGAYG